MTDVTPPIKVSGVPLDSRASRRIKAGEGGLAERLAFRMQRIPALLVSWIVANVGAVLLATVMVGLGFFVTKVLLSSEAVADADAWLPRWLEEQRTPFLNDVSYVTSHIADRWVLIPLVGIVVLSLALRKRWRLGSFYLQAILAEVLTYGLVTRFIERPRPEPVEQLDTFNLLHSYPPGTWRRPSQSTARWRCCSQRTSRTFGRESRSGRLRRDSRSSLPRRGSTAASTIPSTSSLER